MPAWLISAASSDVTTIWPKVLSHLYIKTITMLLKYFCLISVLHLIRSTTKLFFFVYTMPLFVQLQPMRVHSKLNGSIPETIGNRLILRRVRQFKSGLNSTLRRKRSYHDSKFYRCIAFRKQNLPCNSGIPRGTRSVEFFHASLGNKFPTVYRHIYYLFFFSERSA